MAAFPIIVEAIKIIYSAYKAYEEHKEHQDIEQLKILIKEQDSQIETVLAAAQSFTLQNIIEHQFDDIEAKINALGRVLKLMAQNPEQAYLAAVAVDVFEGLELVGKAVSKIVDEEHQLKDIEGLLVTAVAKAVVLHILCCSATQREESLLSESDLSAMRDATRQQTQNISERAMEILRKHSDARFHFQTMLGEPIPRGGRMIIYYYDFNREHYAEAEAYPGRNNSAAIAEVKKQMTEHQNRVLADYPGIADIDQMVATIQ